MLYDIDADSMQFQVGSMNMLENPTSCFLWCIIIE